MPTFDDDEDEEWSLEEEGPDETDRAPEEAGTVRCRACGKWIIEDTTQCPYCRKYQSDHGGEQCAGNPLWITVTVVVCLMMSGGVMALYVVGRIAGWWR